MNQVLMFLTVIFAANIASANYRNTACVLENEKSVLCDVTGVNVDGKILPTKLAVLNGTAMQRSNTQRICDIKDQSVFYSTFTVSDPPFGSSILANLHAAGILDQWNQIPGQLAEDLSGNYAINFPSDEGNLNVQHLPKLEIPILRTSSQMISLTVRTGEVINATLTCRPQKMLNPVFPN